MYEWYFNGVKMQNVPGEISVDGNTLTIFNLQDKHNGMYQCAASNYLGTSMSEAQLRVLCKYLLLHVLWLAYTFTTIVLLSGLISDAVANVQNLCCEFLYLK